MGEDVFDKLIVDKIEKTKREEELTKEIQDSFEQIQDLEKQDIAIVKTIPKPSTLKLEELQRSKRVLFQLIKENRQKYKDEEIEIRKERRYLLGEVGEREIIKNRIKLIRNNLNKLHKEQMKEMKKRKVWKDGNLVKK